ncbi:MAG: hypothetical protein K8R88_10670 [Armatimonadetes bacterium]|nr:hypothetical protein [Armatimonadota bacterium]
MLAAIVTLAFALAPVDFTPPPDGSVTYTLGLEGAGGNDILADLKWHWNEPTRGKAITDLHSLDCNNVCRGMVHFAHKACDTSCDMVCESSHRQSIPPYSGWLTYPVGNPNNILEAAEKFGFDFALGNGIMDDSSSRSGIDAAEQNPKLRAEWNLTCWNSAPCTLSTKNIEELTYKIDYEIQFYRLTRMADGSLARTNGPVTQFYREMYIVDAKSMQPPVNVEACKCALGYEEHANATPLDKVPVACISIVEDDGDTRVATGQEIKDMNFQVVCNDMSNALVTLNSPLQNCSMVKIPAGWEFDCEDGSAQDTQLVNDLNFDCSSAFFATKTALMAPKPQAKANTMCLEIKKKEPNAKLKYRLKQPSTLARLKSARLTADSRRYVNSVQVRTWIITDYASFTDISKLLIPAPAPATYLRELHTAHRIGGINPAEPKAKALYDNELLSTPGVEPEPMEDFVKAKLASDREATMKWVRTSAAKSFADWFKGNEAAVVAKAVNTFVTRFARAGDDGRLAVAEMLASKNLAPHLYSLKGEGISALAARLTQPVDGKLAEALVVALEKTKHPSARFAALNAHKSLSAGLKRRLEQIK